VAIDAFAGKPAPTGLASLGKYEHTTNHCGSGGATIRLARESDRTSNTGHQA